MKPGAGKAKGNSFENTVAKKLTDMLSPLKFIRTQGSGARVGGKNFETLGQMFGEEALKLFVGDVVPVNEKEARMTFLHSVECKFYQSTDTFVTLMNGNAKVFKWMQESIEDAKKIDKTPMIIFKWNRTPIYVGVLSGTFGIVPRLTMVQDLLSVDLFELDQLNDKIFWVKEQV